MSDLLRFDILRIASSLPKGDETRHRLLALLREAVSPSVDMAAFLEKLWDGWEGDVGVVRYETPERYQSLTV